MRCFRTLSSGKPPSTFLSHINFGGPFSTLSQIRKRPAVSSAFKGMTVIAISVGGGKVKSSSVDTHVARCNQRHLSQNSIVTVGAGSGLGGRNVEGSRSVSSRRSFRSAVD